MSERKINETGCEVSISHITGDIVCQHPSPYCDCLIQAKDATPREIAADELARIEDAMSDQREADGLNA